MRAQDRLIFKAISVLLRFPDQALIESLPVVRGALEDGRPGPPSGGCKAFIDYIGSHSLVRLQEEFCRVFDLSPETCLNMSYHRHGEGRERGTALSGLVDLYRNSGYEILGSELPDYLPLMLEFLSLCDEEDGLSLIREWAGLVDDLAKRLKRNESPYAALLETVWEVLSAPEYLGRQVGHG